MLKGAFLNDDVKLKRNSKRAVRISEQELAHKMLQRVFELSCSDKTPDFDLEWYKDNDTFKRVINILLSYDKIFQIDNKYSLGTAFIDSGIRHIPNHNDIGSHILGMHTLSNGLTVCGFRADYEDRNSMPFAGIYFDGKNLRLFIPVCGNAINLDYKCVLGFEEYTRYSIDEDKLFKRYLSRGICQNREEFDFSNKASLYLSKYAVFPAFGYNWNAIREELETSIEIVEK